MKYSTNSDQQGLYRGAGPSRIYMFYVINSNLAAAVKKSQATHCWLLVPDRVLSADCVERTCIDLFSAARRAGSSKRPRIWHLPQLAFITTNTWHTQQEKSSSRTEEQRGGAPFGTVAYLPCTAAQVAEQIHQNVVDKQSIQGPWTSTAQ